MSDRLFQIKSYTKFAVKGKNRHAVHSPFVYEMCEKVLRVKKQTSSFNTIEKERSNYKKSKEVIEVEDLGAGSKSGNQSVRKISTIAKYSLSSAKQCKLLYQLVEYYKPKVILELGTSLGISTSYLAKANPNAMVYSIEGSLIIHNQAEQLFERLGIENIQAIHGDFKERLPTLLADLESVDFAFIDGNHTYKNTIKYFEEILSKSNNETIVIVDDIYWSKEMNNAWKEIQTHQQTTTTIDLFYFGIVLLRKEMSKEHFILKY